MATMHPVNPTSQFPDHVDQQSRNQHFDPKPSRAPFTRGGGGGRGGGRGSCHRCGDPSHYIRECPLPGSSSRNFARRGNQAFSNDSSKVDVIEYTSATTKARTKPLIASAEILTNSEPAKPVYKELPPKNVDVTPLLAKIKSKEKEVELRDQKIDDLKSQLKKTTSELSISRAKNEEMILDMKKSREDLEKCRTELSYSRDKAMEINMKWRDLNNEFEETKDKLNKKIKELEEENAYAESEMIKMNLETEQWRKAAKAIASVTYGNVGLCSKTSELESLVLYYSNRAAKRMSIGKIRKALDDCRIATRLDPDFLKVCLTAGNCYLIFGEIDNALYNFKKCLDSRMVCLDRRLTIEASDGLQKAEKVVNYISQSTELLQKKTCESVTSALEVITEALTISCYSEKLLALKGEALFMLQKYEDVVQMCEQTLASAEMNCPTMADSNHMSDKDQIHLLKIWRWNLISRSYFCMAKFDLALSILEKYEQQAPPEIKTQGPYSLSAATIRELFRCKSAGNEAFQSGKYREAVAHYSNAIKQSIESRLFTAICLCNRAAALQALGEVMDAIADCNLAIALDENYMKAISRRANLHEKIRDYEQATIDFQRLISLLEKRSEKKYVEELTVARRRLSSMNKTMKKGMQMDLYLILGLQGTESASEIKKAYHKAALRHHPDKAGKFLARSESGADGHIWKQIFTTIHTDANKLFKIIGKAYSILSDTNKRFKYNFEESMKDDFEY